MKSLYFKEKGEAQEVLSYGEIPLAVLQSDEVKVKVLASPINPADLMFIEKTYRLEPVFPQIAGFEGVGLVVESAEDADIPVGSLVSFRHKGVWAEYVNVPREKLILLPPDACIEKAAQLSLNPLTAWALLEVSKAEPGDWLLLSAGNSSLSRLLIQFARNRNIKTLAIIRNEAQKENLMKLGASAVLSSEADNIAAAIAEITKGERVSAILDAVGGPLVSSLIENLSVGGKVIHYGLMSDQEVSYHNSDIIFRNLSISGFGIDAWLNSKTRKEKDEIMGRLISEVFNESFELKVSGKYTLSDYREALQESRSSKEGKILFWNN